MVFGRGRFVCISVGVSVVLVVAMASALEVPYLSGRVNDQAFGLVVWEVPFTQSFNSTSKLRQLLGALQGERGPVVKEAVSGSGAVKVTLHANQGWSELQALAIDFGSLDLATIEVRLDHVDGGKTELELERKRRIPEELRTPVWFTSLKGFRMADIAWIHVRVRTKSVNETVLLGI